MAEPARLIGCQNVEVTRSTLRTSQRFADVYESSPTIGFDSLCAAGNTEEKVRERLSELISGYCSDHHVINQTCFAKAGGEITIRETTQLLGELNKLNLSELIARRFHGRF